MTRFKKLKEKIEKRETPVEISYSDLEKYLNHYGYYLERCNGSHHIFTNEYGGVISFPVHGNTVKKTYILQTARAVKGEENE